MLSFQIKEETQRLLKSLDEAKYFFDCLRSIDSTFPKLNEYIQDIASGGEKANQAVGQLRSHLSHIRQKITDVRPRSFFRAIEKLQNELRKPKKMGFNEFSQLDKIDKHLDEFSQIYETYIENYTPQSAGNLVVEGRTLLSMLDGFKEGLAFYLENIESDMPELENGRELSLILKSTMILTEFIQKLISIHIIYSELCMLLDVSEDEFPIRIIKIESGSLWAKVFGNSKVIALLTDLIESGVRFVYRNYTTEGRMISIPRKVQSVESVLKLREKLIKQGINVDELNEHISKASVLIAIELNKLISGQAEIILNDDKISIGDEIQKTLIETKNSLKIEFNDDEKE